MEKTAQKKNTFVGTVVSNKMAKTVVVRVERFVKHPKYGKYMTRAKKYKAHYEGDKLGEGSRVCITACKPISKDKRFIVTEVMKRELEDKVILAENE